MASHRHTATAPVTAIESVIKKYSSGMALANGSMFVAPRIHCSSVPYFSNKRMDTKPPGSASSVSTNPTPRSSPSVSESDRSNFHCPAHPLQQRSIFFEQEDGHEAAGKRKQREY